MNFCCCGKFCFCCGRDEHDALTQCSMHVVARLHAARDPVLEMAEEGKKGAEEYVLQGVGTILGEVDKAVGVRKPPAIEYILVRPHTLIKIPFTDIGIGYNTYGHAAVRYTMPDGTEKVMNINGRDAMVQVRYTTHRMTTITTMFTDMILTMCV